ncbi:MAG TPA: phosphopantothenoylcysteine decarboxylase, partial [Spirochaetota bacterium]|nr:phosphopantothenoylcysteine decarboxylase [Spirochaetota bacterium]
ALADEAYKKSRDTVFIHGPINEYYIMDRPYRCVPVESTADLLAAVLAELSEPCVLIMAAAPADYTPVARSGEKIKKSDGDLVITMKRTPDILKNVAEIRKSRGLVDIFVAGFAAETINTEEYAVKKLKSKSLDMICLNDVSVEGAGFNTDTNIMTIFTAAGERIELPMQSKNLVAENILRQIEIGLSQRG